MAKVTERQLCPLRKIEIVTLEDDFGAKTVLQLPLLSDGDLDLMVNAELEAMAEREQKFRERATARGHKL